VTRSQIIKLAVRDLLEVGLDVRGARYAPVFNTEIVEKQFKDDTYGYCDDDTHAIYLREDLETSLLYRIYVHEIGHAFGLGHTEKGLMAPNHSERLTGDGGPTPRQRKRWVSELVRAVTRHRIRKFKP
jgi:hypothetical protein